MRALLVLAALALLAPTALPLPGGSAPCDVPAAAAPPGAQRVDEGPDRAVRIAFRLAQPATGTFAVWFALRAALANPAWPAERAAVAGFLERADGTRVATLAPNLAVYPYGVQADAGSLGVRADAADGACWGGFGAQAELSLDAGDYQLVVLGASEAGSRFAAFLPGEAQVQGTSTGPATMLSAATMACAANARVFASGALAEALQGCSTPLHAAGRAYRSLVATWGPDATHDVRWVLPDGSGARCRKAPNWCVDTGDGPAGDWRLDVPLYVTLHQPSPFLPVAQDGYSGIFGVFAGRP